MRHLELSACNAKKSMTVLWSIIFAIHLANASANFNETKSKISFQVLRLQTRGQKNFCEVKNI